MKIKSIDYEILNEILNNSRKCMRKVSKKLEVPLNTIYDRIRNLEILGCVKKYISLIDPKFIHYSISCILIVESKKDDLDLDIFEAVCLNNLIELTRQKYFIELFLKDMGELQDYKREISKYVSFKKVFFIRDCIKRQGFLF